MTMEGGFISRNISIEDLPLKVPCSVIVSGPTMCGKTELIKMLVKDSNIMFLPPPASILYAYGGSFDPQFLDFSLIGAHIIPGIPGEDLIDSMAKPLLLILDDLMFEAKPSYLQNLFTREMHHKNLAVVLVTQNLFDKNIIYARKNATYIFMMNSPCSELDLQNIQRQLFTGRKKYFYSAYKQAAANPYDYLLIDMHPKSKPELRLRTKIFPTDNFQQVFLEES